MEKEEIQDSPTALSEVHPQSQNNTQPVPQISESSLKKSWLVIGLTVLVIFLLGIAGFFTYQYYVFNLDKPKRESALVAIPSPGPITKAVETYEDSNLLNSINIDEVMRGIASDQIPHESIKIELGHDMFQLQLYQKALNDSQYQKLSSYLNFTTYPSSQKLTLDNTDWKAYSYSEASDIFTKEGYMCHLLRPNRFDIAPSFACAQVGKLKNNSLENVSNFIQGIFEEAGINCNNGKCEFEESKENMPLPMYTRSLLFFENTEVPESPQQLNKVNKELSLVKQKFASSNWEANIEDYTSTEKKWAPDTLTSQRLVAKNNLFNCVSSITIGNFGNKNKRKMIDCSYILEALTEKQEEINKAIGLE